MKNSYRFIGHTSAIGSLSLRRFGQKVELTTDDARSAVNGGCALVPEAEFWACGFTEADLRDYATPAQRARATDGFTQKYHLAIGQIGWHVMEVVLDAPEENGDGGGRVNG